MSRRCGSSKPTPTLLNGRTTKPTRNAQIKGNERSLSVRDGENDNEIHRHITLKTGWWEARMYRRKSRKPNKRQTLGEGGEGKQIHRKREGNKKRKTSHSPVLQSEWTKYPDPPRLRALGDRQDKTDSPVPQLSAPITQTTARY